MLNDSKINIFREPWIKEYFKRLRAAHQNHYEQFGELTGFWLQDLELSYLGNKYIVLSILSLLEILEEL